MNLASASTMRGMTTPAIDPEALSPDGWRQYYQNARIALHHDPRDIEALTAIHQAQTALSAYDQAAAASPGERIRAGVSAGLSGLGQAVGDIPMGVAQMVAHPVQTILNLPQVPGAIARGITSDNPETVARTVGNVGSLFLPAAKLSREIALGGAAGAPTVGAVAARAATAPIRAIADVVERPGLMNRLTKIQIANAENQNALGGARVEQIPAQAAITDARTSAIPLQQQILADRAILTAFRRDAAVADRAGLGQTASGAATPTTREAMLRAYAERNMAPELVDGFMERARRIPGSGLPRPEVPTSATATTPAQTPHVTPSLDNPESFAGPRPTEPRAAKLWDEYVNWVRQRSQPPAPPEVRTVEQARANQATRSATGVMEHSPADVARAAHAQVMEATGDPLAARAAAAEAAGRARAAVPEPPQAGALPRVNPSTLLRVNQIVAGAPSPMARQALLDEITNLQPWEQQQISAALPPRWKAALGMR